MRHYVGSDLPELLRGPVLRYSTVVDAWRDGFLELAGVPIRSGRVRWQARLLESAEVSLSVPATDELIPDGPYHPLAPYGQEVAITAVIGGPNGSPRVPLGRFRIGQPRVNGDTIEVPARDLGVNIERSRLVTPVAYGGLSPQNPDRGRMWYITSVLRPVTPFYFSGLVDEPLGALITPMRDRLAALEQMLEAWGALARFDASGALIIYPQPDPTRDPVLELHDGERGTVVAVDPNPSPSAEYNACIAQGQDSAGGTVLGGAYVRQGPMAWPNTDPASQYGMNPGFYFSPLLRTADQCARAAQSILDRWQRGVQGTVAVELAPDPRLEVGDKVRVTKGSQSWDVELTAVELPLTAEDGAMRVEGAIL